MTYFAVFYTYISDADAVSAVRPEHRMVGHTGFLVTARRLAPGVTAPPRKRRPAPGAYGEDYTGPR